MELPKTVEELQGLIEKAKLEGKAAVESSAAKVLEGTSFKSLEDMRSAYAEASKKISEQGTELGELRKLKETPPKVTDTSADDLLASITDEERDVLAGLYEKNKALAEAIDSNGKAAMAEALKSLREVKPNVVKRNPFKKAEAAKPAIDIKKSIREAILGIERGSNGDVGRRNETDNDGTPKPRSGMSGYFKK